MLRVDISSDLAYPDSEGSLMKTKRDEENMYQILVLHWKMVHAFHLANNYRVYNMNNPIQYEPVGHLADPFTTNAATRGERFQNGDLFLWNLVISAPYTVDNPHAIFNPASTNLIAFFWTK